MLEEHLLPPGAVMAFLRFRRRLKDCKLLLTYLFIYLFTYLLTYLLQVYNMKLLLKTVFYINSAEVSIKLCYILVLLQ